MNKNSLSRAMMTPSERRLGRFLRAPEGHGDGGGMGDSGGGGDNQGGNPQPGNNESQGQNNSGQDFDPNSFWQDPAGQGGNSGDDEGGNDDSGQRTGQQIIQAIDSFSVNPLFTAEVAQQISEGNFESVNASLQTMMQGAIRQSIALTATIMQDFERNIESRISGMINQNDTRNTDEGLLRESFTSYTNPAMQPMIRGVFNQALRHSGGDRQKALTLTRSMLQTMGEHGGADFGNPRPARGPDDFQGEGPSQLVQELLSSG